MSELHTLATDGLLSITAAIDDPTLEEMEDRATREGFPTVGPEVGRFLRFLVVASNVRRVFECGSGFGYSAYWMAGALPEDGEIVLTELDDAHLADARATFEAAGLSDRARFEHGDALAILDAEEIAYDLILIDHEKARYPDGFEIARDRVRPGGMLLADNACKTASYTAADVLDALEEVDDGLPEEPSLRGIVRYVRQVMADPAFETALLPLGEGVLASVRTPQ